MSHVLLSTWYLIISRYFSTENWLLIFPASIGDNLRNPPLYSDGRVKHHIHGRNDKASGIPQGPKDQIHGTIHMKVKSNPRPNLHSRTWEEFGLNLEPLKLDHIYKVLDLRDQFEVSEAEIPSFINFGLIGHY